MEMLGRVFQPTHRANGAFLRVMWSERARLQLIERSGFSQFFYLTLCGFIESALALVIKRRLHSIRSLSYKASPVRFDDNGLEHALTNQAIVDSLSIYMEASMSSLSSAPLGKLTELYSQLFPEKLVDVLGKDLFDDVQALVALRNLFAHGRDIYLELVGELGGDAQVVLDGNPLQKPLSRLVAAGLLETTKATASNHPEMTRQALRR